tara:strand:- start:9495 stop:11387 length:1893 start_codon:yes stop_codon:yes gene_type:complete
MADEKEASKPEAKDEAADPVELDLDGDFGESGDLEDTVDVDLTGVDTYIDEPKGFFESQDTLKQLAMIIVLFVSLVLSVMVISWLSQPEMRPIVKLEMEEMIPVLDLLEKHEYEYELKHNVLSVDEDQLQEIRLLLAREGISVKGEKRESYLKKDSGFGVSQQLETARLKFEQEQNLAVTIEELKNVKRAKVILALPQQNIFAREKEHTSATVVINLKNTDTLPQEEIDAVVDIVASAVQGLDPMRITVTDQFGRLLNSGSQDLLSARARRELELVKQKENEYMDKIDSILLPVLGRKEFIAQVDVMMDFTSVEQTSKRYNPDTPAIRSEMVVENHNKGSAVAGIPGALTNQPPMESNIPEVARQGGDKQNHPQSSHSEATRNYELDTTINHTRQQIGVVRRVSVSVAVNYKNIEVIPEEPAQPKPEDKKVAPAKDPAAEGDDAESESESDSAEEVVFEPEVVYERIPRTEAELLSIRRLLEGAIGFSESRGDVLEVVNVRFMEPIPEKFPQLPFWETDYFWSAVELGVALLCVLAFIFAVLRPLINRLMSIDEDEDDKNVAGAEDDFANDSFGLEDGIAQYSYAEDGSIQVPEMKKEDEMLQAIRSLVENEPDLAVQVVKIWLEEDSVK